MNILMIHNIRKEFLNLDVSQYQLTFDDGLFSQYYYFPFFENNPYPRIFFITTGFIQQGKARKIFDGQRHIPYVKSRDYMHEAFVKNHFDQFMRVEELKRLSENHNITIGAHSHFHDIILTRHPLKKPLSRWKLEYLPCPFRPNGVSINRRSKLAYRGYLCSETTFSKRSVIQWTDYIRHDTELCLLWFDKHLGFQPTSYCFPFNEYTPTLVEVLKAYGFKYFYNGKSGDNQEIFRRLDIDTII